jgi:hypothetical protein
MSNQKDKNNLAIEPGLKIPVIDLSLAESGKYLSEPETINDSLLELLGETHDLSSLQHHQCDFDGDQLIVTPASRFPQISQEIRRANEPAEYPQVVKRDKTDYSKPKYTNLKQIAAAIKQNSIGYVATLIGRVQSLSNPYQKRSRQEKFESAQRKLLGKLFDALQIEVDSPKSAARYQDHHEDIVARTKNWVKKFPSPLFDYKKDERVYKTSCLPTSTNNNINCIAEQAVNPLCSTIKVLSPLHCLILFRSNTRSAETAQKRRFSIR